MRQKVNFDIEILNQRGRYIRNILLNMSDDELLLYTPALKPQILENVKKRAFEMRVSLLAKN
ncbi:MAG TPA: hypothetical protein VLZ72_00685 [Flavobacterium sp.]|nr:hypothetical protein [Flavobacterium sp.]